ncbi:hypothetical protein JY97_01455 [Alkalispirochaeta odontotermitis]|nr:hypothetical protein JY97_01455 [Alkalispirochaeta odontotermitis]CAB1083378.1 hypothetical protein D1AOALGA4SA_10948 [Olavius algarvensis Delta 1 endosymbiont]
MNDCQNINAPTAGSRAASTENLPNVEQITQTIVEVNTCLRIVQMYPPTHAQVQRSLKQACEILNQVLDAQPQLIVGIAKNTLLIGGKPLDPKNTICKNFAAILTKLEVAALKFSGAVTSEELLRFLLLMVEKPDEIQAKGGIQKMSQDCGLSNIQIQAIDYGKFQFTEETEITNDRKTADQNARTDIWQSYIVHLISGTLTESTDGKSLREFGDIDPVKIAEMLNRNQIDLDGVLQTYGDVLKDQAAQLRALHSGSTPDGGTTKDPNSADPPGAPFGNLQNLNLLLQELNPDLKRQFLAVTFEQCNTEDAAGWTDEFLDNFSDDLIADMLQQENQEGREISPTLLGYIQKYSKSGSASPNGPLENATDPTDNQPQTAAENAESDNDPLLKQPTGEMPSAKTAAKELLPVQDILESLADSQLCNKIAVLLMSFMKDDCDHEKYKAYGENLVDIADELLEAGNFALLKSIMIKIDQQGRGKGTPENQGVARELSETWQSSAFASKAVQMLLGSQGPTDPQAYDFLRALGPRIVPGLVEFYGKQKNPQADESLSKLLTAFKAEAATEAQKRLQDTRPEYVRNMVKFLRRIDAQKAVPQLRALMERSNTSVQMEVLVALLEFKDGWAAYHLRKLLQSDRSEIAARALAMAARYKVKEIVPDLLAMLKTRVMFKTDIQKNEQIITALGQIGDTAAIPALVKLAKSGGLFRKDELLHMKQVLFTSLQGYPMDAVGQLVQIGQKSKDKNIRNACRNITARAN